MKKLLSNKKFLATLAGAVVVTVVAALVFNRETEESLEVDVTTED